MIAQWNLARFAETLLPLLDKDPERAIQLATEAIESFSEQYESSWLAMMRYKLGLEQVEAGDAKLAQEFMDAMQAGQADFTLAWRNLADAAESNPAPLRSVFRGNMEKLDEWLPHWQARLTREKKPAAEIAADMRRVNPYVIPRNHLVEQALEAATIEKDFTPFNRMLEVLSDPHTERDAAGLYAKPASPEQTACHRTFCGT